MGWAGVVFWVLILWAAFTGRNVRARHEWS